MIAGAGGPNEDLAEEQSAPCSARDLGAGATLTRSAPGSDHDRPFLAPRIEMVCHIAMCVTMGYMLVLVL